MCERVDIADISDVRRYVGMITNLLIDLLFTRTAIINVHISNTFLTDFESIFFH